MREPGFYWIRFNDHPEWVVAEWYNGCWMMTSNLSFLSDLDLPGLEVAKGPRHPAVRDFIDAVIEALRVPKMLDWLTARLR